MSTALAFSESGQSPGAVAEQDSSFMVYTPESLAAIWPGYTPSMIREHCRARRIPSKKIGKGWIIPAAALATWMAEGLHDPLVPEVPKAPKSKPYTVRVA